MELSLSPTGSWNRNEPLRSNFLKNLADESESQSLSSEEVQPNRFESNRKRFGQAVAELKTKGGSQPRHYKANVKASGNPKGRAGHLKVELSRLSPQPYQICMDSEILYPSTPYDRQSLKGKKVIKQTELRWGQTCESSKNFIKISATAERTRRQQLHERQNMEEYHECKTQEQESPIACYDYLRRAGFLNKYNFNIKYNNVPVVVQNVTSKMYRALKTLYYQNTDVADIHVRNQPNTIKAVLRIDPQDRQRVNITIKTPRQNVTMTDLWAPIRIPRVNVKRSFLGSVMDQMSYNPSHNTYQYTPVCKVQTNSIRTFDGEKYHAPLTQCYSVLAKDCSEEQRFAVLAKRVSPSSNKKVIKIITQSNEIKLKKSGSEIQVVRNGENMNVIGESNEEQENSQIRCVKSGPYVTCHIDDAGIKVYYDGVSANVKTSNLYAGKLCGLCGHMNYEGSDDFQSPNFEPQSDKREFQHSYIYQDEECEKSSIPEAREFCSDENCEYQSTYEPTEQDEDSFEQVSHRHQRFYKKQQRPRKLNRMMQKMGQQCFSKEPIPSCPEYTYPKEARQEEVEYTCLDDSEQQTQDYTYQAQNTPIPELRSQATSFTRMEIIPNSCRQHSQEYYEL